MLAALLRLLEAVAVGDAAPESVAEVVERLRNAGAVTVAKLATHELAWGTTTQNPHFGSCRNPQAKTTARNSSPRPYGE